MKHFWILACLVAATGGCGDDARTEVTCGSGDPVAIDGTTYCVFEQAVVVENGFECPPSAPFLTQAAGFGVCAQQAMLPPVVVEDIHLAWQTDRGACVVESECVSGKACVAGVCQTPANTNNVSNNATNNASNNANNASNNATCVVDADCGVGESCVGGVCEQILGGTGCGGLQGLVCEANAWCNYGGVSGMCGAADQMGTCTPRPEVCTDNFDPVCGCDGVTYSNACDANAAGADIIATGECA